MTIQDLLDSGIDIQGSVIIKRWLDEVECYETIYSSNDFKQYEIPGNVKNWSITYMYTDVDNQGYMVIEVE